MGKLVISRIIIDRISIEGDTAVITVSYVGYVKNKRIEGNYLLPIQKNQLINMDNRDLKDLLIKETEKILKIKSIEGTEVATT